MSIKVTSTEHHLNTTISTLAELRTHLANDDTLPAGRRRDMISALASLGTVLGCPLEAISTDPAALRKKIAPLTPAMAGLKPGRWRNVRSLVSAALAQAGIVQVQGRIRDQPSTSWLVILALLGKEVGFRFHLARFARYCTLLGIEPVAVNDVILSRYEEDLSQRSLVSEPKRSAREAARAWNKAVDDHPAWPQTRLTIPDNRNIYAPDWSAYPNSLILDIEAWCESLSSLDPFADTPGQALRPASIATRRKQLRCFLGALILAGVAPAELVDLRSAVTPNRAKLGLKHFWDKAGREATAHTGHLFYLVMMIARHYAQLPKAQLDELAKMAKHLRPRATGMSEKNKAMLRPLDDLQKQHEFVALPVHLMDTARRLGAPTVQIAHEVQTAVILELLVQLPIRIGNLRQLRIGVDLLLTRNGGVSVVLPGREVKNNHPMEAPLPKKSAVMIRDYIDKYRPLLSTNGADYLFPGKRPMTPKGDAGTRSQIQKALADHCGIKFNPHTFRHFAARVILRNNPGGYGQIQRVLAHRSLNSTMAYYSGLETPDAVEHYDALITSERAKPPGGKSLARKKPEAVS